MSTTTGPYTYDYATYGTDNCTLEICPIEASILRYQPSYAASGVFIGLFALSMVIHAVQGFIWRHTLRSFSIPIIIGCIDEIIGYVGRIILHPNPFNFDGFLIQIICITTAPVFVCAAIYVTLARTIMFLNPHMARFNPKFLYWFFIPCDIISLVFQAAGGAMSSVADDAAGVDLGVDLSLFGLSFQVFTLVVFIILLSDYLFRYIRAHRPGSSRSATVFQGNKDYSTATTTDEDNSPAASATAATVGRDFTPRVRLYFIFMGAAIFFILIRCVYRIDELSDGYNGPLIADEGLFYGLESAMMVAAVFCLNVAQPGYGLREDDSFPKA